MKYLRHLLLIILTIIITNPLSPYADIYLAPPGAVDAGINVIRMKKKKLIIFAVGNVCVSFDFSKAVKKLKKYTPVSEEKILKYLLVGSPSFLQQELGVITAMEFYNQFMKEFRCNVALTYKKFTEILTSIFQQNIQVMALMNYLLDNKYNVAILSNAGQVFKEHHIAHHPVIRKIHEQWHIRHSF